MWVLFEVIFALDQCDGVGVYFLEIFNFLTRNLLTVCAMEEIDSCPMEGFDPRAYDRILNLEEKGLRSVLVLPVGYRAEDDFMASQKKVRRGTDEVILTVE